MHRYLRVLLLFGFMSLIGFGVAGQLIASHTLTKKANRRMVKWHNVFQEWEHLGNVSIDSVKVFDGIREVAVYFSKELSYMPVRESSVDELQASVRERLRKKFNDFKITLYVGGIEYSELIPNIYRGKEAICNLRTLQKRDNAVKLVSRVDALDYSKGLDNNHIAIWHSHGWYYEQELDRWEWQRARLFGTVEDIFPMTYVIPYLVPMLENAGANVFLPRERDVQTNEVIVDNDKHTDESKFYLHTKNELNVLDGFGLRDTLFLGDNPFTIGTSNSVTQYERQIVASYVPEFSESGFYAVYVAYFQNEDNCQEVEYKVNHSGGSTSFIVDQTRGGSTWIYLGTFKFLKGLHSELGSVEVFGKGQISIDAVRFGGGMGNVARRPLTSGIDSQGNEKDINEYAWKTSHRPRYMEAARYWMQYAGMPDDIVYSLNGEKNDYKDDYQSRGNWVNYLKSSNGLNIPIDLAFAFHTDAGLTPNDSTIGTLGIYSSDGNNELFTNGQSKLASRDLCDVVQTEIVNDISSLFNKQWTRRAMWDKQYSEAWRPDVPTMLLELLSHQNLADMRYGLDPRFRFAVSRSIYKGILKFQAFQEGRSYVIQPLPVDHMAIEKTKDGFVLKWQPVTDSLEASARALKYKVYKRVGDKGFDNGTLVTDNYYAFDPTETGEIVSFKVSAINEGGESLPGEILSMGIGNIEDEFVLVVNAFDRVSAPDFVDLHGFSGIASWQDEGVADKFDFGYTGQQYDFDRQSAWLDDDSPGWGASYGNEEGRIIPGNSFDNTYTHGDAILAAGYSFVSISDEVFVRKNTDLSGFKLIDIILGEEKTSESLMTANMHMFEIYTPEMIKKLKEVCNNGVALLMSGAYIGSDMIANNDTCAIQFAEDFLRYKWRTNHAVKSGGVYSTDHVRDDFQTEFHFNTTYNTNIYKIEAPDAIEPVGGAKTAFRFKENNSSAGVLYQGEHSSLILGFPFETIVQKTQRHSLMRQIIKCLVIEGD